MAAHEITTSKEQRRDGLDWWRSTCSCGKYTSGLHSSPGHAEQAGHDHAKAKSGGIR